jgi:hypothetical protein
MKTVIFVLCSDLARIVAAGENENDLNHSGLYSNKTVMVIIINIYDRAKFLPVTTCKQNPS